MRASLIWSGTQFAMMRRSNSSGSFSFTTFIIRKYFILVLILEVAKNFKNNLRIIRLKSKKLLRILRLSEKLDILVKNA